MQKVYVANPDNRLEQYRLVINVTEYYSVGIELSLEEVQQFYYELKDLLDARNKNKSYLINKIE